MAVRNQVLSIFFIKNIDNNVNTITTIVQYQVNNYISANARCLSNTIHRLDKINYYLLFILNLYGYIDHRAIQ